jgi:hypothetical protein
MEDRSKIIVKPKGKKQTTDNKFVIASQINFLRISDGIAWDNFKIHQRPLTASEKYEHVPS